MPRANNFQYLNIYIFPVSGHSKWAQIKHKKAATDAKRGQLFSKLVREITISARIGGTRPDMNSRLRTAIDRAKHEGMPKENVERAILRAAGGDGVALLQEFLYEATAPGGVAILIEGITDNKNRTIAEIKHIVAEHGGRMAKQGSLVWNFDKIGVIEIVLEENKGRPRDDLELLAIEAGARDLRTIEQAFLIETTFADVEKARRSLEGAGIVIHATGHDYKPKSPIPPPTATDAVLEKLLDALTDQDDVQEVYDNIAAK